MFSPRYLSSCSVLTRQSVPFQIEAGNLADLNYIASLIVRMLSKEVECQNGPKRTEPESRYLGSIKGEQLRRERDPVCSFPPTHQPGLYTPFV